MAVRDDTTPVDIAKRKRIGLRPVINNMRAPSDTIPYKRVANVLRELADERVQLIATIVLRNER